MNFIKTHKKTVIVMVTCLILMILAIFAVYKMLYPNSNKSPYGHRLENAPAIDNAVVEKTKSNMLDKGNVNTVMYELRGPIMKFYIDTKKDTKVEDAQKLADIIIETFSNTITQFYDIEVYITQKENETASEYPVIGYHSKDAKAFSFVVNKAGDTDEK